jgi:hypothetical protein
MGGTGVHSAAIVQSSTCWATTIPTWSIPSPIEANASRWFGRSSGAKCPRPYSKMGRSRRHRIRPVHWRQLPRLSTPARLTIRVRLQLGRRPRAWPVYLSLTGLAQVAGVAKRFLGYLTSSWIVLAVRMLLRGRFIIGRQACSGCNAWKISISRRRRFF